MEDLALYMENIVEPTIKEFENNPWSVRHAFLACVTVFHSIEYLAFPRTSRGLRQEFRKASSDFELVDHVAHAFKHVVAGDPNKPTLRANEVVRRRGTFAPGVFSPRAFDVGSVTMSDRPDVNLLMTVRRAAQFLRDYRPPNKG